MQEAVGDAEADTGTPALGLGPYPTPYFTAQSSWGPSGHVTSSLDTPGSLPPPSPAEEPLGTGFSGGFSTNPLYGQSRSGPPSVRPAVVHHCRHLPCSWQLLALLSGKMTGALATACVLDTAPSQDAAPCRCGA